MIQRTIRGRRWLADARRHGRVSLVKDKEEAEVIAELASFMADQ
jgi:hypothetical protein